MLILSFTFLSWAVACWFSAPFGNALFGLFIFEIDPVIPFLLSVFVALLYFLNRFLRGSGFSWHGLKTGISENRKTIGFVALILGCCMALQLPSIIMYRGVNNSDSALAGLASYHIADDTSRPMFRYGHHYDGTLISHTAAFLNGIFGRNPAFLYLSIAVFYVGFVLLLFLLVRQLVNERTAFIAAILAAVPPREVLFHLKYEQFVSIMFWGTASLLILNSILKDAKPRKYFWLGAVLGIGFWMQPQMLYYILTVMVVLFIRDKLFFIRLRFYALPLGFLAGGIVTFVDSYYYNWPIIQRYVVTSLESGNLFSRFIPGLGEFIGRLPDFFGLRGVDGGWLLGEWPSLVVLLAFATSFVHYIWKYRTEFAAIIRFNTVRIGPALFLILFLSIAVIFSSAETSIPPAPFRHLTALWAAIVPILALSLSSLWEKRKIIFYCGMGLYLSVFLYSQFVEDQLVLEREILLAEWEKFCDEREIDRFYGQFWRSYLTSFISSEKIIGNDVLHQGYMPYPPYYEATLNSNNAPAFLLSNSSDKVLELTTLLDNLSVGYKSEDSPIGTVIFDLDEHLSLARLKNIAYGKYVAQYNESSRIHTVALAAEQLYLLQIVARNSGEVDWHANGRTGFVELVISNRAGSELRRLPLDSNISTGESAAWTILLTENEFSDGKILVSVRVNDFKVIDENWQEGISRLTEREKTSIAHEQLITINAGQATHCGLAEGLYLVNGWAEPVHRDGLCRSLWSGAPSSTLGFLLEETEPISLVLKVSPFKGVSRAMQPQTLQISCNGKVITEPVPISALKMHQFILPAEALKKGYNRLQFQYGAVENEYFKEGGDTFTRLRPRAVRFELLRIIRGTGGRHVR